MINVEQVGVELDMSNSFRVVLLWNRSVDGGGVEGVGEEGIRENLDGGVGFDSGQGVFDQADGVSFREWLSQRVGESVYGAMCDIERVNFGDGEMTEIGLERLGEDGGGAGGG